MTEREPGHRHISHVYAIFPGWQITSRGTPELAEAARQTIAFRLSGGGTTRPTNVSNSSNVGWSLAWNSALWARLERATIRAAAAGTLRVRLGEKTTERPVRAGDVVSFDAALRGRTGP